MFQSYFLFFLKYFLNPVVHWLPFAKTFQLFRDLKPENILLSEDMHVQITDFGTAKQLSSDSKQGITTILNFLLCFKEKEVYQQH